MRHSFKRFFCGVLTFAMVLSCVPAQAIAVETCGHSYEVTVAEPTCTEDGSIGFVCSLCGDSYSEPGVAAEGHDYQEADALDATCGDAGSVTYACTVCGETEVEEILATGAHSYTNGICSACGAENPDAIPAEEPADELIELPAPEPADDDGGDIDVGTMGKTVEVTLTAKVTPAEVSTAVDPEEIQISVIARDDQNRRVTDLNFNYMITDMNGNELELEVAVQTAGSYTITPTYVPNSKYSVTVVPATLTVEEAQNVCVNEATGETFESVSAALAAAKSGETVRLNQDYTESDEIILRTGVTLDVGKYTLTAENYLIGLDGSYLDGDPFDIDGTYGKVITKKSLTMLTDGAHVDEKGYSILPIYYNDGYVFTRMEVNTDRSKEPNRGLTIDAENNLIKFQFVTNMTGDVRKNILNDGATGNNVSVVIRLEWEVVDGDDIAYQDFVYNDKQIAAICGGGKEFTFKMVGYDALNIDLDTLVVKGIVIADCGVTEYGTPWSA